MRIIAAALPALLTLAALPQPAGAQGQINEGAAVTVDPERAYIFYRAPRKMSTLFLRESAPDSAASALPFERNFVTVHRDGPFTKQNRDYSYLLPVEPGTYILYGQRDLTAVGWLGVCLCMGSVRFDAPAGRIVDLGTITYPGLVATGAGGAHGLAMTDTGVPSIAIVPSSAGASLPGRLAGLPVVPAVFRAADKMPNYYRLYVDRHPALEGVLDYERDRVIDLGGDGASP